MKIASLDIGLKRIGIAISLDSKIVTPLPAVIRKSRKQASKDVSNILQEWQIEKLIIGIPTGRSYHEMKRRFTHFVSLLDFQGEIHFQDEDLSTQEALELMEGEMKFKKDGRIDSISAKIILDRFLSKNNFL